MSSARPAIAAESLSKVYRVGGGSTATTLREALSRSAASLLRRRAAPPSSRAAEFWALRDVSFDIRHGEAVGIIGRNGAGKSTLLKVLSRVTEPTSGRARVRGRLASILEVGTGFHPDLTGRENVYLNGAILGMDRRETARKFDEIVAFAEVAPFIDTPVKRYSSGMYMRLAFAVAAHLDPEILVIDEVLAVGDAAFQRRCLGKMGDVAQEGRTILFVSHNMAAITSLCPRAILLEGGRVAFDGRSADGVLRYFGPTSTNPAETCWAEGSAPGDEFAALEGAALRGADGAVSSAYSVDGPVTVEIRYRIRRSWNGTGAKPYPHFFVRSENGTIVLYTSAPDSSIPAPEPGSWVARAVIPANLLNAGSYSIDVAFATCEPGITVHFSERSALYFTVSEDLSRTLTERRNGYAGPIPSAVWPALAWYVSAREDAGRSPMTAERGRRA